MPPPGFWPCRYRADEKPFRRAALLPHLRRLDLDCGKAGQAAHTFSLGFSSRRIGLPHNEDCEIPYCDCRMEQLGGAKKAPLREGPFLGKFFAQAICRFQSPSRRARSGLPLQTALQ